MIGAVRIRVKSQNSNCSNEPKLGSNWEVEVKMWRLLASKQGHSVGQWLTKS
jgi:hypothetical protein